MGPHWTDTSGAYWSGTVGPYWSDISGAYWSGTVGPYWTDIVIEGPIDNKKPQIDNKDH